ncbi:uncharacterized protein LOC106662102 [Cimex lectularius]|uniref:Uncharacterized protein n=1 Tax=Cimex lectularius TaxID=79782 RepID=A0A8I6RDU9_CIMLE|nr:uncharacterized protein LOC106662102 [Cimex lectularius]
MSPISVVVLGLVLCCGFSAAEPPKEPAIVILDSVGQIWETLGQAKITEVAQTGINGETGRGKKTMQLAIPLIVGFKIAGAIIAALGALKVLVIKSVVLSGFAVVTSLILAGKYIYDKMKHKQEHVEATPYYYPQAHVMAQQFAWDGMYDVQAGTSDVATDLNGHYSQPLVASITDNHTAYNYIPTAERKSSRPKYRTTVYRTTVKQIDKK